MKFQIVLVEPPAYSYSGVFQETSETLMFGLRALGHEAQIGVNQIAYGATNIVFDGQHLSPEILKVLPKDTVFYNLEQIHEGLFQRYPVLKEFYTQFEVWDYSLKNIEQLPKFISPIRHFHLPIGYIPNLTRIVPSPKQDIDVLFYGAINPRRRMILEMLRQRGLVVQFVTGVFGARRDTLIARSKVVLNIHFYETRVFEIVRVAYVLANRKAVVSEISADTAIEPDLINAVAGVEYEHLVDLCIELVADDSARQKLEMVGFERMKARDEVTFLRTLLAERAVKN